MTATADVETVQGRQAEIAVSTWPNPEPRRIVILAHGYGEHLGRYDHVEEVMVGGGAGAAGPGGVRHGRSGGGRVVVAAFVLVVDGLPPVVQRMKGRHAGLPLVLIGRLMGGL